MGVRYGPGWSVEGGKPQLDMEADGRDRNGRYADGDGDGEGGGGSKRRERQI